jgi:hypothetical protein
MKIATTFLFLIGAFSLVLTACGGDRDRDQGGANGTISSPVASVSPTAPAGGPVLTPGTTPAVSTAGWNTYTNPTFGYRVRYPDGWTVAVRDPQPGDDFESQSIRVSKGTASVLVVVNLQGAWCESGRRQEKQAIVVSGFNGVEWRCWLDGQSEPYQIVRHFEDVKSRTYTALGNAGGERVNVEAIVESFEFLN